MPFSPASAALEGLTVLDLSRVRSGPTCVRQFADWGANVVKVEALGSGDEAPADFSERYDPDFQNIQRGKRSIALDLKREEGREVFYRLVEKADVVVENFRPDVKNRLRIDYATLDAINPRVIYASISGFGQDGPYRDRAGVDQIAQGMSGTMSITGEAGRGPMRAGFAVADMSAGLFAAIGVLVALYERQKSNRGQWVQTSLLQAQIFMLDFQAARYAIKKEIPVQSGNNHPTGIPAGAFKTADGYVNIAPTPPMWRRFCRALGLQQLVDDPSYATLTARLTNRDKLNVLIEEITVRSSSEELIKRLNDAGVPCGPIYGMDQVFADEQVRYLSVLQPVHSAVLGEIALLAQPLSLSRTPSRLTACAPEYREHSKEILSEFGFTQGEIESLEQGRLI
jgi:crotonobetainyl-CoA:carnitine CoA-transferase CaiB-like acyl-CoA transferase